MIGIDPTLLQTKFEQAQTYEQYMEIADSLGQRQPWDQRHGQLELTSEQRTLVEGFTRQMRVLCLTGTWCGDCALQGSAMQRIAETNPNCIELRFLQRDEAHADLIVKAQVNAGFRVPVTWFLAEDFEPVVVFGDRTLSRYRAMARKAFGDEAGVVHAPPPEDPVRAVLQEVLDEFERVQLLLRLSGRLREKHGD